MKRKWYYQLMGETSGPFSTKELLQLAADGQINHETLIRKGDDGTWVLADKVRGLLDNASDPDPDPDEVDFGGLADMRPTRATAPPRRAKVVNVGAVEGRNEIICPRCSGKVWDLDAECPHCGISIGLPDSGESQTTIAPPEAEDVDKWDKLGRELAYLRSLKERAEEERHKTEIAELAGSLVACVACGNQISRTAPMCPHCGDISQQRGLISRNRNLVSCKVCGEQISRTAPSCPHCGQSVPGLHLECLKCHSTNVVLDERGFGLANAAAGYLLLGPVGLLGGMVGRKQTEVLCRTCGNRWIPTAEELRRLES